MNTATDAGVVVRLPQERSAQQETIDINRIAERLQELEGLYRASQDATETFSEAIKDTAEESGLLAKSLRKFIVARVRDKVDDQQREVQQLQFLFEEIGE